MADKTKYHFLTGDAKTTKTLEFENDAAAIDAAKKTSDVIRVQHDGTTKYTWERPAVEAKAEPEKPLDPPKDPPKK